GTGTSTSSCATTGAPRVDREGGAPAHLESPHRTDLLPPPGDQDAQVRGRPPPGRPRCARGVRALDPCRHLADARHGRRASLRTQRTSRAPAQRRPSAPIDRRLRYASASRLYMACAVAGAQRLPVAVKRAPSPAPTTPAHTM